MLLVLCCLRRPHRQDRPVLIRLLRWSIVQHRSIPYAIPVRARSSIRIAGSPSHLSHCDFLVLVERSGVHGSAFRLNAAAGVQIVTLGELGFDQSGREHVDHLR